MFGLSFGELLVIIVVALVIFGPEELPKVLRKAGQFAGKMRRMASDLRTKSGIDDVLKHEGIAEDLHEIRKLARGELDGLASTMRSLPESTSPDVQNSPYANLNTVDIDREREYPRESPDTYDALPDTAVVYTDDLPPSECAKNNLYTQGLVSPPAATIQSKPSQTASDPTANEAP